MPRKATTKKTTKRKTTTKKEPELAPEAPPTPAPAPAPAPAPEPVKEQVNDVPVEEKSVAPKTDDRIDNIVGSLDNLILNLTNLSKSLKDAVAEAKVVKKDVVREGKKRDKTKKRKTLTDRPPSGFAKPTKLTDELCEFMGIEKGSLRARTEVTKFFCEYFKTNSLQDPNYKRNIIPNEPLKKILRLKSGDEVSYFNLQKYLKIHYPSC